MKPGKGWKRGYKFCGWDYDQREFTTAIGGLYCVGGVRYGLGEVTRPLPNCGPLAVFAHYHDAAAFAGCYCGVLCSCWYKPYSGLAMQPVGANAPRTKPRLWVTSKHAALVDLTTDFNCLPPGTHFADEVQLEKIVSLIYLDRTCPEGHFRHSFQPYDAALQALSFGSQAVVRLAAYVGGRELPAFGYRRFGPFWDHSQK
jgi:hypothetical protein